MKNPAQVMTETAEHLRKAPRKSPAVKKLIADLEEATQRHNAGFSADLFPPAL